MKVLETRLGVSFFYWTGIDRNGNENNLPELDTDARRKVMDGKRVVPTIVLRIVMDGKRVVPTIVLRIVMDGKRVVPTIVLCRYR
jgi:hypothetical protein